MAAVNSIKPKIVRTDLAPRAVPETAPEEAVREYFLSKFEGRLAKKKPEWDRPPQTPATELVVARRDLAEANRKLTEKWEEQKEKEKQMKQLWGELRNEEKKLKESFIHFNVFVKENKEKRDRAIKKIEEEQAIQRRRGREIKELEEKLAELTQMKENLEKHVNKHKMYEEYLQTVVSESNEFSTVFDILNRYETLNATRLELTERQERDLNILENANCEMMRVTEEKAQVILGLNNKVAELQARYDKAKAEALRWESALSNIKNTTAVKSLEIFQVKSSCWTMYRQICRRKNMPLKYSEGQVEEQLSYIKHTIQELKKIERIVNRRAVKEAASTAVSPTGTQR